MSPALLGFLRGLAFTLVLAGLGYVADVANLTPLVGAATAGIIASLAASIEHAIAASTGKALFGAVSAR